MKSIAFLLALGAAALWVGAAEAQVAVKDRATATVVKSHPARPADAPVEILLSEPRDRKVEDLCLITATGGHTIFNAKRGTDLFERMKVEARKCGADAIVIRSTSDQTMKPLRGGIDQGARAEGVAIRYVDTPPAPEATPPSAESE